MKGAKLKDEKPKVVKPKTKKTKKLKAKIKPIKRGTERAKKLEEKAKKLEQNRIEAISDAISARKDCMIFFTTSNSFIVVKNISVNLNIVNDKSVFQPREYTDKRNYCVVVILKFSPDDEYTKFGTARLEGLGASAYTVNSAEEVGPCLDKMDC